MIFDRIIEDFTAQANSKEAAEMRRYMREQFEFLGVRAVDRRRLANPYLLELDNSSVDWEFISKCWASPYREFKYVATDYLYRVRNLMEADNLNLLAQLIKTESWWDTSDSLDAIVGHLVLRYPHLRDTMRNWAQDENSWIRRVAITHQLSYKCDTNIELLSKIIELNLESKEFFINKAIGWALREYSKTNPHWVAEFIALKKERLHPLSIREGQKHLLRR